MNVCEVTYNCPTATTPKDFWNIVQSNRCSDEILWEDLFHPLWDFDPADDDGMGPWITPRTAKRIFSAAIWLADQMYETAFLEDQNPFRFPPLPFVARPYFRHSAEWRQSFMECHRRIAIRLLCGRSPSPNCRGEEMALHNILQVAQDRGKSLCSVENLTSSPHDDNFDLVARCAFGDFYVLKLFEDGDKGYNANGWRGHNLPDEKRMLGPVAKFLCSEEGNRAGAIHMHPNDWFIAFDECQYISDMRMNRSSAAE